MHKIKVLVTQSQILRTYIRILKTLKRWVG